MKSGNGFKIIDLNGEGPNGEKAQVELTPSALAMIEKARREASQAKAREEALHSLMTRELAERDEARAREPDSGLRPGRRDNLAQVNIK